VWAITGGSFTTDGTHGISPVQVLHWNGSTWKIELSFREATPVYLTGLAALSADDAYVIGQNTSTKHPFSKHWDGNRWRTVPLEPAEHMRRPGSIEYGSLNVAVTSDGSVAALHAKGLTDRTNFLWLRCQHEPGG